MKIVTAQEMRAVEALADSAGLPYARMMENAGSTLAQEITRRIVVQARTILVLVGPGNNGGDGLVAARYLHDARANVVVYLWRERTADDTNFRLVQERKVTVVKVDDDANLAGLIVLAGRCDIVVDALLGTGGARPIEGTMKAMLDAVRSTISARLSPPFVVAVDLPSGLNSDTGALDPAALPANLTVTFAFPKRGLFLFPGAALVGELVVADIGIPAKAASALGIDLSQPDAMRLLLPARPNDAHKGSFGKLLVVAGCLNYTGAAYLATSAAYRSGAGLVTMALARSLHPILAAKSTEATFLPLPEADQGYLSAEALPELLDACQSYDTLLVGCGLGAHPQTCALVAALAGELKARPAMRLVVDADGLNALAGAADWPSKMPPGAVLTPHPGEMSRLSGLSMEQIAGDRIGIATAKAKEWSHVIVLKGAYTVIVAPDGRATINPFANSALATAGTGDVLAGTIAGLLAQGMLSYDAAVLGAYVHGLAAEIVCRSLGSSGLVAGDLLPALPLAMHELRKEPQQEDDQAEQ